VGEHDQRLLLRAVQVLRDEHVRVEPERVARSLGGGVGGVAQRRPREPHDVDLGDVAEPVEEHDVVDLALEHVDAVPEALEPALDGLLHRVPLGLPLCAGGEDGEQAECRDGESHADLLWHDVVVAPGRLRCGLAAARAAAPRDARRGALPPLPFAVPRTVRAAAFSCRPAALPPP
jgi:hypothetical protein